MVTQRGDNGKKIEYSLSHVVHECERDMYIVEMPILVCNNKRDAERINTTINTFLGELSRAVLNDK